MRSHRDAKREVAQLPLLATADAVEIPPSLEVPKTHANGHQRRAQVPERIHIERLIMHKLDHWEKTRQFADTLAEFGEEARKLFAEHIKTVIAQSEWDAYFADDDGPIALLCSQLLGSDEEFIESSKLIAQHLYDAMTTRAITRGDLVAAIYRQDDERVRRIAIFKLDLEKRQVRNFDQIGEKTHVNIRENDNILPQPEARHLTKCALLSPTAGHGSADGPTRRFGIQLLDAQAGPRSQAIAAYFFRGFLKAELLPNSRRRTQEFWKATTNWLGDHELDLTTVDKESFYEARRQALSSAITVGHLEIEPFVQDALRNHQELHEQLITELERAVLPSSPVSESTGRRFEIAADVARPIVRKVIYELDGGARLIVPADDYHKLVKIEAVPDQNKHRIVIETHTFREVER